MYDDIRPYVKNQQWDLILDYHFGGYAKVSDELRLFIKEFNQKYLITLEPIYTGKMAFGVLDLISKGKFPEKSKVLIIHTGGLQGLHSNIGEL